MIWTIENYKGQLVIVSNWETDYNTPTDSRLYYPTGIETKWNEHLLGKEVKQEGNTYYIPSTRSYIDLIDGGQTKPVHRETRKTWVKKPRGKSNYIWEDGKWIDPRFSRAAYTERNPKSGAGDLATSDIRSEGKESNPFSYKDQLKEVKTLFKAWQSTAAKYGPNSNEAVAAYREFLTAGNEFNKESIIKLSASQLGIFKYPRPDIYEARENPGFLDTLLGRESTPAEENFEHFHGIESEEQITDELDWPPPADLDDYGPFPARLPELTALGELVELTYEDPDTLDDCLISFDKPRPLLASDYGPEGHEDLFIVGGEYSIDGDDMILGCLLSIVYQTKKSFDDSKPVPYKHRMAEPYPMLATNEDGTQLYILRGESKFSIDRGQPVSAGIVG